MIMEKQEHRQHSMTRRAFAHDYSRPGVYHITMHVNEALGHPLGIVVPEERAAAGATRTDATVMLSDIGKMVEHELLTAITARYPMVNIQDYVVMPEHLHFIMVVQDRILSNKGTILPIGQVIAGFKQGCNRRYWEILEQRAKPADTLTAAAPAAPAPAPTAAAPTAAAPAAAPAPAPTAAAPTAAAPAAAPAPTAAAPTAAAPAAAPTAPTAAAPAASSSVSVSGGFAAGGRVSLFAPGFCDVMPVDARQLETQRTYIRNNPKNRLLRSYNRACLSPRRQSFVTALTLPALRKYLLRECGPSFATPATLTAIESRLLTVSTAEGNRSYVALDTFGDHTLLTTRKCLPVVCHRKSAACFEQQRARCMEEAARGALLISARIAPGEQRIIDEVAAKGYPVALIADNGFADRYHPSERRLAACTCGSMLIATPWHYEYRPKDEHLSVSFCKTMNCVVQAVCRLSDDWWQQTGGPPSDKKEE